MVGDDPLRGGVELPGPAVVPQPFPGAEHVGFRRCRELRDGRKPLHVAEEKIDDPIDLRLLEHHLADPGAVGIGPSTPGEITPHPLEPAEEGCLDRFASGPEGRRERPVDQVAGTAVGRLSAPPGGGPADPFAPLGPRLLRHDPLPSGGGSFPTKVGDRPGIRSAVAPGHDPWQCSLPFDSPVFFPSFPQPQRHGHSGRPVDRSSPPRRWRPASAEASREARRRCPAAEEGGSRHRSVDREGDGQGRQDPPGGATNNHRGGRRGDGHAAEPRGPGLGVRAPPLCPAEARRHRRSRGDDRGGGDGDCPRGARLAPLRVPRLPRSPPPARSARAGRG